MTIEEYKQLVTELKTTDSIKRGSEIVDKIYDVFVNLLHKLTELYDKYGFKYVEDDDYRDDRGSIDIDRDYINENCVTFIYSDHWKYGGECEFSIDVESKYLDEKELKNKEKELVDMRISDVKRDMLKFENAIKKYQSSLEISASEYNDLLKKKEELNG